MKLSRSGNDANICTYGNMAAQLVAYAIPDRSLGIDKFQLRIRNIGAGEEIRALASLLRATI